MDFSPPQVLDVNENLHAPVFSSMVVASRVREAAAPHTPVVAAPATDADTEQRDALLTYSLEGGVPFYVDQTGNYTLYI